MFAADTLITLDDGTEKPISEIQEGDYILSGEGESRKVLEIYKEKFNGKISSINYKAQRKYRDLKATNGHIISYIKRSPFPKKSTKQDPILERLKLIEAQKLGRHDRICKVEIINISKRERKELLRQGVNVALVESKTKVRKMVVPVQNSQQEDYDGFVYDLTVEVDSNYLAEKIKAKGR